MLRAYLRPFPHAVFVFWPLKSGGGLWFTSFLPPPLSQIYGERSTKMEQAHQKRVLVFDRTEKSLAICYMESLHAISQTQIRIPISMIKTAQALKEGDVLTERHNLYYFDPAKTKRLKQVTDRQYAAFTADQ